MNTTNNSNALVLKVIVFILPFLIAFGFVFIVVKNSENAALERRIISSAEQVAISGNSSSFDTKIVKIASKDGYPTYQVSGYNYYGNRKASWRVKIVLMEGSHFSYYDIVRN